MKRSEMLEKLYSAVDAHLETGDTEINMVDFILDKAVELGMMPPPYTSFTLQSIGDIPSYYIDGKVAWKPEDGEESTDEKVLTWTRF
jgi:hypothetical protein